MPLVQLCTASCLSNAVVIKTVLQSYGIRATLSGVDLAQQIPILTDMPNGIPVLVSTADFRRAQDILTAGDVP